MELDKAKLNQFEEAGMNPFNAPTPGESGGDGEGAER